MPNIGLVAIDLDGTLLSSEKELSAENIAAIQSVTALGVRVVIASARNPDVAAKFAAQLGLNDPMICSNGAQVWGSPTGPIWAYHPLSQPVALAIAMVADKNGWLLSTTIGEMTYWRQHNGQSLGLYQENVTILKTNVEGITDAPIRMFAFQPDAIEAIYALCQTEYAVECRADIFYKADGTVHSMGIVARQATKGAALGLVCDHLGIQRANVMAIGDNLNDVSMMEFAAVSVAMGNALSEVKAMATAVAPDNDSSGVAWALREFVLHDKSL